MSEVSNSGAIESSSLQEGAEQGSEEGQEEQIAPPQEQKAQEKKLLKKLKLKFNGREVEEDLPFEIGEEHVEYMTRQLQMARLSQHKSQELSEFEREVGSFLQQLKSNPRKALSNPAIGIDIKQLAAEILEDEIKQASKTPEQIEKEALESELQSLKEEREREKEEMQRQELERLTEREFERYDNLMSSALESSNLPKSPYVVKKMTEYMITAVENGMDVEPADVIPKIQEEMQGDIQELLRALPPEVVEKLLGDEIINSLRKNRVAASKKPPAPIRSSIPDVGRQTEKKPAAVEKKTIRDFFGV